MPRGVKYATEEERLAARRASKAKYRSKPEAAVRERAYGVAWRAENADKVKANNARWNTEKTRVKYKDTQRQASANWYQQNRDRRAETTARWRRDNPDRLSEYQRRRRARKLGSNPDLTLDQWIEVLEEFGHRCAYCGVEGDLEQDHVWPISRGGRHTKDNMAPACRSCNARKGAKLLAEWLGFV